MPNTKRRIFFIPLTLLLLVIFLATLTACGTSAAATSSSTPPAPPAPPATSTPTNVGNLKFPLTVSVLQGPESGKSLKGTLNLKLQSNGALDGTLQDVSGDLVSAKGPVPVTGQIKGQLIGLYIHVDKDKNIFGTGTIGYDSDAKADALGGTFNGPSDTSTGVWTGKLVNRSSLGGCLVGVPVDGTGLCYIVQ